MNRRTAVRGITAALALASAASCTTPVTMPWDERKPALTGTVWRWTETLMSDDTRIRPAAPERYTLEFLADGATRVRADCNTGSGHYEMAADRKLTLGRMAVTQAACLPGSLGDAYLKGLANVSGYLFDGDNLVLMLRYDSGTMRFVPLKR
jgi:heat shock protein HslJ